MRKSILILSVFILLILATAALAGLTATGTKLVIFGWSGDGKYWAFGEEETFSAGMAGEAVRYYVIDAAKNDFHKKFEKECSEQTGHDTESAMRACINAFAKQAKKKIRALGIRKKHGTEVFRAKTAQWVNHDIAIKQHGKKYAKFKHGGKVYTLKLETDIDDEGMGWATKSKFTLKIRCGSGPWHTLQADKTKWRHFYQYGIVYASVSPDGKYIAVVIEGITAGFEAVKIPHYRGVTGELP